MLEILDGFLQERLEEKAEKILDTEVKQRFEIMLVQNKGIDNLEFQEIKCRDLKFLNENEVHDNIYSNIQQKNASEVFDNLKMSRESESYKQSDGEIDVSTLITHEIVSILSEVYQDSSNLHFIPSENEKSDPLDEKMESASSARIAIEGSTKFILKLTQASQPLKELDEELSQDSPPQKEPQEDYDKFPSQATLLLKEPQEDYDKLLRQISPLLKESQEDYDKLPNQASPLAKEPKKGQDKQLSQASQPQKELQRDHDDQLSQCTKVELRKLKPKWLERFLKRTFFDPCSKHPIRRNESNKYCIDCDAALCQYCLSLASHTKHRVLKIYRHVYKDVVPLDEIERHIDCSRIQPYRCNRQLVISLSPLPHTGSWGKTNEESSCQTCKRKLIEHEIFSYCSISCKVDAFLKKPDESSPPFLLLDNTEPEAPEDASQEASQDVEQEPAPKKIRKRKGIPHRAPFY
ncbi:uncharacterized protein LOC130803231 isoform X2 [Amaranthus tricolor]|nr:uncharacterized protein LOC130803231 isoform X2 [Amaranthus tricolor]